MKSINKAILGMVSESLGCDIGIALQTLYEAVAPDDAGYDLFDEEQLTKARADFIVRETHRFELTIVPHPIGGYWRIFAEQK